VTLPIVLALSWILAAVAPAFAQQKLLTIEDIYDPANHGRFGQPAPREITWLNDAEFLRAREQARGRFATSIVDAITGAERPLFDTSALAAALRAAGADQADAERATHQRSYTFAPDKSAIVLTLAGDLFYWTLGETAVMRLTATAAAEEEPAISPDGRRIAYVRESNLYVRELDGNRERAITRDGGVRVFNGKLDWIYQEEIYGRGTHRAHWWSPDSRRIAFLRLDDTAVPDFTVVDDVPASQVVEQTPYPKPGDPNPIVRLGIAAVDGVKTEWANLADYHPDDLLIVGVDWTPDSRQVVFQAQNREQTWLDLNLADVRGGGVRKVLRETTPAWVSDNGSPTWLKDGSFLWLSERSGWEHLYRYRPDGTLIKQITSGKWEVRTFRGVDEDAGVAYFEGTERSHVGGDVYSVRLDGSRLTRLSRPAGTHAAFFNPSMSMYVGTWSDVNTPPQTRVHRADGTEIRVIDANESPALSEYRLSKPELIQVPTRDGFEMEAMILKPPDFDPTRRYPVFQHTYGGPHAPQVKNAWGGASGLFFQLLAQHGIIVWVCDNRTASGKGAVSAWPAYKRLGELELQDIEDGVTWLKQQPWVDPARIGISGWSYGGFMTSYALTHSRSFAMGIAGGSVTDWQTYDSIYTERYMLTPAHNPDGYRRTAPRAAAADLSGRLLLLHGAMDDNVHVQNTIQLAYELQRAGKPFEMMLYPKSRHAISDPQLVKHHLTLMLDFTLRTLAPERAPALSAAPQGTGG
jgi:dipeptidyl-peptidase-4